VGPQSGGRALKAEPRERAQPPIPFSRGQQGSELALVPGTPDTGAWRWYWCWCWCWCCQPFPEPWPGPVPQTGRGCGAGPRPYQGFRGQMGDTRSRPTLWSSEARSQGQEVQLAGAARRTMGIPVGSVGQWASGVGAVVGWGGC